MASFFHPLHNLSNKGNVIAKEILEEYTYIPRAKEISRKDFSHFSVMPLTRPWRDQLHDVVTALLEDEANAPEAKQILLQEQAQDWENEMDKEEKAWSQDMHNLKTIFE